MRVSAHLSRVSEYRPSQRLEAWGSELFLFLVDTSRVFEIMSVRAGVAILESGMKSKRSAGVLEQWWFDALRIHGQPWDSGGAQDTRVAQRVLIRNVTSSWGAQRQWKIHATLPKYMIDR